MCGRYQLQVSAAVLESSHRNTKWRPGASTKHSARNQVRPTNTAPVLIAKPSVAGFSPDTLECELMMMKWGFPGVGSASQYRPPIINARSETVLKLPMFRLPLMNKEGSQRCAIPATGFYEWYKSPAPGTRKPTLTPYLVRTKYERELAGHENEQSNEEVFYMAGIFNTKASSEEPAFVIMTTDSCKRFRWIHDRQPVFLSSLEDVEKWINDGVMASEAVNSLKIEENLSWTRMTKDLSSVAKGKAMVQKGLDSFFKSKNTGKEKSPKGSKKMQVRTRIEKKR